MPLDKIEAAMRVAGKFKRAGGGEASQAPYFVRNDMYNLGHKGPVMPKAAPVTPPLALKGNPIASTPLGQAAKGMKVDKRWSLDRLRTEVEKAA